MRPQLADKLIAVLSTSIFFHAFKGVHLELKTTFCEFRYSRSFLNPTKP